MNDAPMTKTPEPLHDAAPCVNLERVFPAYRIAMSLDHETGHERDPWNFEIPCARWKGRLYPHGGTRLQAWITTHRVKGALVELQGAGATPYQVGDAEATVIFDVKDFPAVAAVLRPKLKRVLSEDHLRKLIESRKAPLRGGKEPDRGRTDPDPGLSCPCSMRGLLHLVDDIESASPGFRPTLPPMVGVFAGQASQYPKKGPEGIGYFKGDMGDGRHVDVLLYRDSRGRVIGILNHYPVAVPPHEKQGNINVLVHPDEQRKGIGVALMREAGKRWSINLAQQRYTPAGAALANRVAHGAA